jgi:hypothetical protein
MRHSMAAKWEKYAKLLWALPLPSRALKYFPPEFIVRDPLLSLVHAYRRKGRHFAIFVIHLNGFQNMLARIPYSQSQKLIQNLKSEFIKVLKRNFSLRRNGTASLSFCTFSPKAAADY